MNAVECALQLANEKMPGMVGASQRLELRVSCTGLPKKDTLRCGAAGAAGWNRSGRPACSGASCAAWASRRRGGGGAAARPRPLAPCTATAHTLTAPPCACPARRRAAAASQTRWRCCPSAWRRAPPSERREPAPLASMPASPASDTCQACSPLLAGCEPNAFPRCVAQVAGGRPHGRGGQHPGPRVCAPLHRVLQPRPAPALQDHRL